MKEAEAEMRLRGTQRRGDREQGETGQRQKRKGQKLTGCSHVGLQVGFLF